jgi:hypothetical protein
MGERVKNGKGKRDQGERPYPKRQKRPSPQSAVSDVALSALPPEHTPPATGKADTTGTPRRNTIAPSYVSAE